jgi:hypothetical protein
MKDDRFFRFVRKDDVEIRIVESLYGGISIDDRRVGSIIVGNRSDKKDDDVIKRDQMEG